MCNETLATIQSQALAICMRCHADAASAFSPLCPSCDAWHDRTVAECHRACADANGPQFGWRGIHLQVDIECTRLVDAFADDPLAFAEAHGEPVTNERAREIAAEAIREGAADLLAAFDKVADAWIDERRV